MIRNRWIKAKASDSNGSCVEVLRSEEGATFVRDSKDFGRNRLPLQFTPDEWAAFLDGAKKGEFDD